MEPKGEIKTNQVT